METVVRLGLGAPPRPSACCWSVGRDEMAVERAIRRILSGPLRANPQWLYAAVRPEAGSFEDAQGLWERAVAEAFPDALCRILKESMASPQPGQRESHGLPGSRAICLTEPRPEIADLFESQI